MTLTRMMIKYLLVAVMLFAIMQNKSYGGGLPVRPGSLTISPSVLYFFADKGWDSLSHKSPFAQNGKYTSISYSIFAQYGISKRFALVVSLPYVISNYTQIGYQSHSSGLTDLETGIKYYLANINYTYYFSLQGTLITPLYTDLNLGYAEPGSELKLSFAGSGKVVGRNYFFNVDEAVRQYYGNQGPVQDRYSATFGLSLDRRFKNQVIFSVGGEYSTSSFTTVSANQALNKNFSFNQATFSFGHAFTRSISVFVSAGTFISGRNTGDGSSASISLNLRPFRGI